MNLYPLMTPVRSAAAALVATFCLAFAPALLHAGSPTRTDEAPAYASFDWAEDGKPSYITLRGDRFVLGLAKGVTVWDAQRNQTTPAQGWPEGQRIGWQWAPLGEGTLVFSYREPSPTGRLDTLVWWDAAHERFAATLPLPEGAMLAGLMPINADMAVACMRLPQPEPDDPKAFVHVARALSLRQGTLAWEAHPATQALADAGLRGPVEGAQPISEQGPQPPLMFDTRQCKWRVTTLPPFWQGQTDITIKPYTRLDGRIYIGQAQWYEAFSMQWHTLNAPLLWDATAQQWRPQANTAQRGSDPGYAKAFGPTDPIVSKPNLDADYAEFFNEQSQRWVRSAQSLGAENYASFAPLSNGDVLVFLIDTGRVVRLSPGGEGTDGQFLYPHSAWGAARLPGGQWLLGITGYAGNRFEVLAWPSLRTHMIAPLPSPQAYYSVLTLPRGGLLVYGGLPPKCLPSTWPRCQAMPTQPAQLAYRYLPAQDQWQAVPELAMPFAPGPTWGDGRPDGNNSAPRADTLVGPKGEVYFLSPANRAQQTREHADTLFSWRGQGRVQPLARLLQPRSRASLIALRDGRLAVVGGLVGGPVGPADGADGPPVGAQTTEILPRTKGRARPGPKPHFAGGQAVVLGNGRIFKLTMPTEASNQSYQAEVADARMHRWHKLPAPPMGQDTVQQVVVSGQRVLLVPENPQSSVVAWIDARHRWQKLALKLPQGLVALRPLGRGRYLAQSWWRAEVISEPGAPEPARGTAP